MSHDVNRGTGIARMPLWYRQVTVHNFPYETTARIKQQLSRRIPLKISLRECHQMKFLCASVCIHVWLVARKYAFPCDFLSVRFSWLCVCVCVAGCWCLMMACRSTSKWKLICARPSVAIHQMQYADRVDRKKSPKSSQRARNSRIYRNASAAVHLCNASIGMNSKLEFSTFDSTLDRA